MGNPLCSLIKNSSHPLSVLDSIRLNFSEESLMLMNIVIAFIMFGVALNLDLSGFKDVYRKPKAFLLGIFSQFIALPALTYLLILLIEPTPSVALGMILVAACPGGNISNFISSISKANLNLSVSLTAFVTLTCVVFTPANFAFWGHLYSTKMAIPLIEISFWEMFRTVVILLGLPVALGVWCGRRFPILRTRYRRLISTLSILAFGIVVLGAFVKNFDAFVNYIHLILLIVLAHNALALLTGYLIGRLGRLPEADTRTLCIETGIQNSALGLVLIFNPKLFNGLGGMAFIAAWWGIWHIVSGLAIAAYWSRKAPKNNSTHHESKA